VTAPAVTVRLPVPVNPDASVAVSDCTPAVPTMARKGWLPRSPALKLNGCGSEACGSLEVK
jgi:hypothetical protein